MNRIVKAAAPLVLGVGALIGAAWGTYAVVGIVNAQPASSDTVIAPSVTPEETVTTTPSPETPSPSSTPTVAPSPVVTPPPAPPAPVKTTPPPAPVHTTTPAPTKTLAPRGTPLPSYTITDPKNANYGKLGYEDPGLFCASHTGSTINGVPQCD